MWLSLAACCVAAAGSPMPAVVVPQADLPGLEENTALAPGAGGESHGSEVL